MVCFCVGNVSARIRDVVFGLIERLLRRVISARERTRARQWSWGVVEPSPRLRDLGRERGHLLGANTDIDIVARSFRGGELRARLGNRRGQLDGGQLGYNIAGMHACARLDLDGGE